LEYESAISVVKSNLDGSSENHPGSSRPASSHSKFNETL